MGCTACTEPQCLYNGALYLTVELYLYSPYGPYGMYRAPVPVQWCTLPLPLPSLASSSSVNLWIHRLLQTAKLHVHVNVLSTLDEINLVDILLSCFNIIVPSTSWSPKLSLPFGCSYYNFVRIIEFFYSCCPLLLPWYLVLNTNYEEPLQAVCFIFWSLLPSLIENLPLPIVAKHSHTVVFLYFETPSVSLLSCCTCYKGWVGLQNWRPGFDKHYSRILFYDGSLLRPLSSRTEHSQLVVHHCRNSSVLSLLSALLALLRCACVSYYSSLVQFFWLWFFHQW
jgi:hypothetical protein